MPVSKQGLAVPYPPRPEDPIRQAPWQPTEGEETGRPPTTVSVFDLATDNWPAPPNLVIHREQGRKNASESRFSNVSPGHTPVLGSCAVTIKTSLFATTVQGPLQHFSPEDHSSIIMSSKRLTAILPTIVVPQ